eukprot:2251052-Prymnesium_polylepis.1
MAFAYLSRHVEYSGTGSVPNWSKTCNLRRTRATARTRTTDTATGTRGAWPIRATTRTRTTRTTT